MTTTDLITLLAEAQTEIINATDAANPVAVRLAAAIGELDCGVVRLERMEWDFNKSEQAQ